ncbi:uncharacterized protein LOC142830168 [Pelodiscus sinensis]|uniref:uncharacterized protein LOC142830168 n=1 Tax=Pelodiscus sinensis TaxID=13735 RepID=UPI003F6A77BE
MLADIPHGDRHLSTLITGVTAHPMDMVDLSPVLICAAAKPLMDHDNHLQSKIIKGRDLVRRPPQLQLTCRSLRKDKFRIWTITHILYLQKIFRHPPQTMLCLRGIPLLLMTQKNFRIFLGGWLSLRMSSYQMSRLKQFKLWRNLHPKQQSKVALPIDKAILQSAAEIWHTPASTAPTSTLAEKRYFVSSKDSEFLFTHPQLNSLVVDAALQRAKNPQLKNVGADKEAKKLDIFGRKVYSLAMLLLRIANYAPLLANHSFNNIVKLTELAQRTSEADKELLRTILKEGYACSKANLQVAMDVADTAARGVATAVSETFVLAHHSGGTQGVTLQGRRPPI